MCNDSENIVRQKSFDFSLAIIALYKKMIEQNEYIISKQLLRSATSIGANIEEATAAISYKDFAAKMSISSKEARETHYWLKLIQKSNLTNIDVSHELLLVKELISIITSIVKTTQKKINSPPKT